MAGEEHLIADRYRLLGRIASGGMGDVWRALDTRIDRLVAVKLLHSSLSSDERFRARFEAEARLVASVASPGVATLHDYGTDEGPFGFRAYLVMELVDGEPMRDLIDRGPLPPAETMRLVDGAATGLAAAHRAGIIHRDVKPENILVTSAGGVKLIDFGIARATGSAGLTEVGKIMGTVAYSSPEQISGDELTPSTDVYSLAVVAYEALTGVTPFAAESLAAVMNGHINRTPPPLPDDVPGAVVDAVSKGLEKDPSRRWRDVEEFGAACRLAIADADSSRASAVAIPAPRSTSPKHTEPMPRRRFRVTAVALVVLVVLSVGGFTLLDWAASSDSDHASPANGARPSVGEPNGVGPSGEDDDGTTPGEEPRGGEDSTDSTPGEEDAGIEVLDVVGESTADAARILRDAGFDNVTTVERPWSIDLGKSCVVVEQEPSPGSMVDPSTPVTVHYTSFLPNSCKTESAPSAAPDARTTVAVTPTRSARRPADA